MHKRTLVRIVLAATLAGANPIAGAAGWGAVFAAGPVQDFNDEDIRLYLDAIKTALEAPAAAPPLEWRNEKSGAGGTLQILGRPQVRDFTDCRRVQSTVHSRRQRGVPSTWTACKDPASGRWALVSAG